MYMYIYIYVYNMYIYIYVYNMYIYMYIYIYIQSSLNKENTGMSKNLTIYIYIYKKLRIESVNHGAFGALFSHRRPHGLVQTSHRGPLAR